jgi:hypothetical protein
MNAMSLFVTGILAGVAVVYAITLYFKYIAVYDYEPESVQHEPESTPEPITMTVEDWDEWYNNVMNIFAIKES